MTERGTRGGRMRKGIRNEDEEVGVKKGWAAKDSGSMLRKMTVAFIVDDGIKMDFMARLDHESWGCVENNSRKKSALSHGLLGTRGSDMIGPKARRLVPLNLSR